MNSYILVPVVLYTAWAIYSGYKYVNGRYPWLEQPEIAHRICKYAAILGMSNKKGAAVLWNAVTGYPYGRTVKCVRTAITATINIAK